MVIDTRDIDALATLVKSYLNQRQQEAIVATALSILIARGFCTEANSPLNDTLAKDSYRLACFLHGEAPGKEEKEKE